MSQNDPVVIRTIHALTQGLNVLGSGLIMALMLLVVADVVGRNFLGAPVRGVPEIVTLSIVAIVFLQVPQSLRENRIPSSDSLRPLIAGRFPALSRMMESVFDLAGIAVMGVIAWSTWPLLVKSWTRNDFIGAIGEFTAPTWPIKMIIILGGSVLMLQFALRIWGRHTR